jgi:hypothetical protein
MITALAQMLPVVALLRAPHRPLFAARAHTFGHGDLRVGCGLLTFLGFLSRSLLLLLPGGLEMLLDGGQSQQGRFYTDGQVQNVVGVKITVE